ISSESGIRGSLMRFAVTASASGVSVSMNAPFRGLGMESSLGLLTAPRENSRPPAVYRGIRPRRRPTTKRWTAGHGSSASTAAGPIHGGYGLGLSIRMSEPNAPPHMGQQ